MQKYKQGLELWNFQLRQAGETGHLAKLIHANTVDRTYTLPDKDGTFAMLSDISSSGVTTFNTRSGVVTLTSADVTTALGYTPFNKAGDTVTSTITSTITSEVPVLESANTTTYGKVIRLKNTGGELRVGVEASVAGTDFASDSPYDSCWYSPSNTSIFKTPLAFFTGNVQVAASGSFQGPGTGLTGTAASLTAGAATTASRMRVGDVRSTTPTPDSYDDSRITAEFNNDALLDLTGWNSKITVAGWQAGYNVWQMAGGSANDVSPSRWFLRDGKGSTWNAWKEVWHSGNLNISDWAKAANKPSYAFSEITSKPTTLSGYGITDAAPKASPNFSGTVVTPALNAGGLAFQAGGADGASYSDANAIMSGWYGLALKNPTSGGAYPNQISGYYDFRNGILDVKGALKVKGVSAALTSGATFTGSLLFEMTAERQIKASGTNINWGMFLNSGGCGLWDWQNSRSVLVYSPSANTLTTAIPITSSSNITAINGEFSGASLKFGSGWGGMGTTYSSCQTVFGNNIYVDPADTVSGQVRYRVTHSTYGHSFVQCSYGQIELVAWRGATTAGGVVSKNVIATFDGSNKSTTLAGAITATQFNGSGAGLTGTASSLTAGAATIANGLTTAASIQGGTGWSYLTLNTTGGSWDIAQCNANYNVLEFRPAGGDTGKIVFYRNGSISAQGMLQGPAVSLGATDGSGINFWGSGSAYTTYMSATSNSTYGGGWDATNADYNMYFRMTSTKRGFVFQNPSTHSETGTFKNGTIAQIKPRGIGGEIIIKDTTTAGKAYGIYFSGGQLYTYKVS